MEEELASQVSGLDPLKLESLLGPGGFKAPRWRTRLAAAQLAVQPFVHSDQLLAAKSESNFKPYEQLLRQLVNSLALQDSQWQVRMAAIESATSVLAALKDSLSAGSFAENVWGLLAACLDPQPEVEEAAGRCISQHLLPSCSREVQIAVSTLCDRFVEAAVQLDDVQLQNLKSSSHRKLEFLGLDNVSNGRVLLAGITAATCLQLLPLPGSCTVLSQPPETDVVPLLVLVVGLALEDAHKRNSRVMAKGLTKFLRCLGSGIYYPSVLSMLNPKSPFYLPGMNLPRMYAKAGRLDKDIADILSSSKLATSLKAVAIAVDDDSGYSSDSDESAIHTALTNGKSSRSSGGRLDLGEEEGCMVLQHCMEMMHVPAVLTDTLNDETAEVEARNFLELSSPLLSILKSVLENTMWVDTNAPSENKLVEDLVLCCATFAYGGEKGAVPLWTTKENRERAIRVMNCLRESLLTYHIVGKLGEGETKCAPSVSISSVVSEHLASLLSRLKRIIKGNSVTSGEETSYANGSLGFSIVAAHQMDWCLRQLEHPHLGSHSSLIMPCVLTALDHFSPQVKRQAMRSLLHLAINLNPMEFRWNKDVLLDAVSRSLIGCEDLWPVAVKLAVTSVICCEGRNPRSSWYRQIFSGMLDELERMRDDQGRRVIWLQEITPQMEAMGLLLVVHFRRLLPLMYYWLHAPDDSTCLLALTRLRTLIIYTWPRIPAHMKRITEEVVNTYYESRTRKLAVDMQSAAVEVLQLLKQCGGQEIEDALQEKKGEGSCPTSEVAVETETPVFNAEIVPYE